MMVWSNVLWELYSLRAIEIIVGGELLPARQEDLSRVGWEDLQRTLEGEGEAQEAGDETMCS